MIRSLLPLTGVQLDAPWSKLSFYSDASLQGFALAIGPLTPEECGNAARFRERWRFVDTTPAHGPEPALGMSAEFEPACAFSAGPPPTLDPRFARTMIAASVAVSPWIAQPRSALWTIPC